MASIARVALVTGSSSGIGAATVRALATPGMAIALHARKNRAGAEKIAAAAREAGAQTLILEGDLAQAGVGMRLVEETTTRFGRLDIVVSNAGFADRRPIGEVDRATWDASLASMTTAFFELATAAKPWLIKAGASGRMIGVSSFVAHAFARGLMSFPASAAAKAGMEALSRALAADLASSGVTVNCVAPGFIATPMTDVLTDDQKKGILARVPADRLGTSDEIAAGVVYLASEEAAYVTGQTIHINGGMAMI